MEFIEYKTLEEQRWDTIAYVTLNDPYGYPAIIEANPQWRGVATLPAGVMLRVPVSEVAEPTIAPESLPPWKR